MIRQRVRKAAFNQVVWSGLILAILAVTFGIRHRYWYNFFRGPSQFDERIAAGVGDPDTYPAYWVTLAQYPVEDLGLQEANNERITARYVSVQVGSRQLLAEVPADYPGGAIRTAEIVTMPYKLRDHLGRTVFQESPELVAKYYSFMARTGSFRTPGYAALALGIVFLTVALVKMRRGFRWASSTESHPVIEALTRYGSPMEVVGAIESELHGQQPFRIEDIFLTRTWLVQERSLTLDICLIADIVWFYQKSPHHDAVLRDRLGQSLLLHGRTLEQCSALLDKLQQRAPWALVGFNQDWEHAWVNDRGAVIHAAMEARQELEGA